MIVRALLLLVLIASGCGTSDRCGPHNCAGCCEPDGFCKTTVGLTCSSPGLPCSFACSPPPERPPRNVPDAGPNILPDAGTDDLRVFTSSARFRGDLTRIAENSDPLAAADSLCQRMAEAEALSGTWLAFLTTDVRHPASRFTAEGPWRTIGGVAAAFPDRAALFYSTRTPLTTDERRGGVNDRRVWTGWPANGSCGGWSSRGGDGGMAGDPRTLSGWASGISMPCDGGLSLYCFEQQRELPDGGTSMPLPTTATKRAFVTSLSFNGDLGGVSGAAQKCARAAEAAGLVGGTWRAWLGSSKQKPGEDFTFKGPWGVVGSPRFTVAASIETLRLGILQLAINFDERGVSSSRAPWTGAYVNTAADENCGDWKSAIGFGRVGSNSYRSSRWQDDSSASCASLRPLYCFEQ